MRDVALSMDQQQLHDECEMFIRLLTLQKVSQLSEGANSCSILKKMVYTSQRTLSTQTGRNAYRGPNLGQVEGLRARVVRTSSRSRNGRR